MTNSCLRSSSVPVKYPLSILIQMYTPALHVPKLETTRKGGVFAKETLRNCFAFDTPFLS